MGVRTSLGGVGAPQTYQEEPCEQPGGARRSQEEPGGAMRTTPATRVMGITERSGQKRTTFESGGAIKKSESDQG